ncbi:sensor histidine kinase [Dyella soli]|nr:ATP-binding protein [Dyella soli]
MWNLDGWLTFFVPAMAAVVFVVLAYVLRRGVFKRLHRLIMEERLLERERMARDLHDTLLQKVHGTLFKLERLANARDLSEDHRRRVSEIEEHFRQIVIEGRDAICRLRGSASSKVDLDTQLDAIRSFASTADIATTYSVRVVGNPRPLRLEASEEAAAIVRESATNAFRHAKAKLVVVAVHYSDSFLSVSIADNGVGMPAGIVQGTEREGHWGIAGMRERAARLGGRLSIVSAVPHGTTVELRLPKEVAYPTRTF